MSKLVENPAQKLELNYDFMLGRFLINQLPPIRPRSIRLFLCAPFSGNTNQLWFIQLTLFNIVI